MGMANYLHRILLVMAVTILTIEIVQSTKVDINPDQDSTKLRYHNATVWKEEGFKHHRIRPRMAFKNLSSYILGWEGKPTIFVKYEFEDEQLEYDTKHDISLFTKHTCLQFLDLSSEDNREIQKNLTKKYIHRTLTIFFYKYKDCGIGEVNTSMVYIFLATSEEICKNRPFLYNELLKLFGATIPLYRLDRDSYLILNFENMNDNDRYVFKDFPATLHNISYFDYTSFLMLDFMGLTLSKNKLTTFATKDIKYQGLLGRYNKELSHRDRHALNTYFGCQDLWLEKCKRENSPCKNGGFLIEDCGCICRTGTVGFDCAFVHQEDYYEHLLPNCSLDINLQPDQKSSTISNIIDPEGWCVYKIRPPPNHVIEINFTKSHLTEDDDDCKKGYIEIRDAGASQGETACRDYTLGYHKGKKGKGIDIYLDSRRPTTTEFEAKITLENLGSKPQIPALEENSSAANMWNLSYTFIRLVVALRLILLFHEMN